MRSLLCRCAALLLAILAAPSSAPAAQPTVTFGAAVALTGRYAREGKLTQQGYDFWKDYVNAHGGLKVAGTAYKVEIKYYDDETNPQIAAKLVEKLIDQDKVNFVLGPYCTPSTFAASSVIERKKMPMVVTNGPSTKVFDQGYRYIFGVQSPASRYLQGVLEMAATFKPAPKTLAIASANSAFPLEIGAGAVSYAQTHGMTVVYNGRFPEETSDASPFVSAMKASNADLFLVAGYLQDSLLFQKGFKELGAAAKLYAYSVGPDTPDFRSSLGRDANAVFGGTQWTPTMTYKGSPGFYQLSSEYSTAFKKKYGVEPEYHNAESTAGCLAFQYAIQKAGSLDTEKVRDALASLDVVTFFGILKFDSRGLNVYKPMAVNQIQNGKLATVWPSGVADAKPLYPAPGWSSR